LFYDKLLRERASGRIRIRSAGIWALEGQPASAYALQVMSEHDLDISAHRGRTLTAADVDKADLILVMTKHHAEVIARELQAGAGKIYLLSEMAGPAQDIVDPYGGSLLDYRKTAAQLADLIERGYPRIVELLGENS